MSFVLWRLALRKIAHHQISNHIRQAFVAKWHLQSGTRQIETLSHFQSETSSKLQNDTATEMGVLQSETGFHFQSETSSKQQSGDQLIGLGGGAVAGDIYIGP